MKMFSRITPKFSRRLNLRLNRIGRKNLSNFVKCWGEKVGNFLKSDGWFFFLLLILNSTIFSGQETLREGIINFYSGAVLILIICAMIHFLLEKFPRAKFFLQVLILIIFAVFFVLDIFLLYKFQVPLRFYMIQIVLVTNLNEIKEFFQAYVLNLPVIIGTAGIIFLIVTAVKKFRAGFKNLSENNLCRISNYLLIILLPAMLFSAYLFGIVILVASKNGILLCRNFVNIYTAAQEIADDNEILAEMNSQNEKIISNNSKIPYVVFVLGESLTRNHMQLYGYKLQNNPLLTARYKRGEIFKFNDVIACANDTQAAMEKIFTFTEKDSAEKWYKTSNIFDILRRTGYHTVWISNQTPSED